MKFEKTFTHLVIKKKKLHVIKKCLAKILNTRQILKIKKITI